MKLSLEIVRRVLRDALGQNSFIASFVQRVDESPACPTASIDAGGRLRYNPDFVRQHLASQEDLFCLVLHEIMHPLFGHFIYRSGPLEGIAADMVINASISLLFAHASGEGSLFKKVYQPHGMEGLLRPMSRMHDSRYGALYYVFYGSRPAEAHLTTGEVIQTLKVLAPGQEALPVLLLGSHEASGSASRPQPSGPTGLSPESLCRIAEELKRTARHPQNSTPGYGENLFDLFLETLKTHLSIKRVMLQKFATKRKVDRFKQLVQQPRAAVTPISLHPSKRDLVLLAADVVPFHYHNLVSTVRTQKRGLAIYLDVSGSVNEHLPKIVGVLHGLKREITSVFLFSNTVAEVAFNTLLAGHVKTTYGTDFDCIAESMVERDLDKAVILTDGYASLNEGNQDRLRRRKACILTVLFGGKADCEEFAPFGDVVQLEDVTE